MTGSATPTDHDHLEPDQSAGFGTQLMALATAACVGAALLVSNVVLGLVLFAPVLAWMYGGERWTGRIRRAAAGRDCRVLRRVLSLQ